MLTSAPRREEGDRRSEYGGGGGGGKWREGEEAFPAVHPFGCHTVSIVQRYVLFVTKDDKPI